MQLLLKYMYTGQLDITCQNIRDLYCASKQLGVDKATKMCSEILLGKSKHKIHCVYIYVNAKKLGMQDVAEKALMTMAKRFEYIVGTSEFLNLSPDQVVEYLSMPQLAIRSEVIVYLAGLKWINENYSDRVEHTYDVISCTRFASMTLEEIISCYTPPFLSDLVLMKDIEELLLRATSYIAAKSLDRQNIFERYSCEPREYLIPREQVILWDSDMLNHERYIEQLEQNAAKRIQAVYRGHQVRNLIDIQNEAAGTIQKAFRKHVEQQDGKSYGSKVLSSEQKMADSDMFNQERYTEKLKQDSAMRNQAVYRVQQVRNLIDIQNEAEVTIQKAFRRHVAQQDGKSYDSKVLSSEQEMAEASDHQEKSEQEFTKKNSLYMDDLFIFDPTLAEKLPAVLNTCGDTGTADNELIDNLLFRNYTSQKAEGIECADSIESDEIPSEESLRRRSTSLPYEVHRALRKGSKKLKMSLIVLVGGFNHSEKDNDSGKTIYAYHPSIDEWRSFGKIIKPRYHHCLVYHDNYLYCIGGCDPKVITADKLTPLNECFRYHLASQQWHLMPSMKHERMYHGAGVVKGKIYVAGGKNALNQLLNSVECYDPVTDSWSELKLGLKEPSMGIGVCSYDDKLWVAGGLVQNAKGKICVIQDVSCYDPSLEGWFDVEPLPYPRAFSTLIEWDNKVYIFGGTTYNDASNSFILTSISDVLCYNETRRWLNHVSLPYKRHYVAAAAVGESIFVLGGISTKGRTSINEMIVLDHAVGGWRKCKPMPVLRCGFAACSII